MRKAGSKNICIGIASEVVSLDLPGGGGATMRKCEHKSWRDCYSRTIGCQ